MWRLCHAATSECLSDQAQKPRRTILACKTARCKCVSHRATAALPAYLARVMGHACAAQVGLSRAVRLAQCHSARITLRGSVPVQVDGEPWLQPAATITVAHAGLARHPLSTTLQTILSCALSRYMGIWPTTYHYRCARRPGAPPAFYHLVDHPFKRTISAYGYLAHRVPPPSRTLVRRATCVVHLLSTTQKVILSCALSQHMGIWPTVCHRRLLSANLSTMPVRNILALGLLSPALWMQARCDFLHAVEVGYHTLIPMNQVFLHRVHRTRGGQYGKIEGLARAPRPAHLQVSGCAEHQSFEVGECLSWVAGDDAAARAQRPRRRGRALRVRRAGGR